MSYSFVWENYCYELIALYLFVLNEFIHFSINQLLYVILLENDDIWTAAEPMNKMFLGLENMKQLVNLI